MMSTTEIEVFTKLIKESFKGADSFYEKIVNDLSYKVVLDGKNVRGVIGGRSKPLISKMKNNQFWWTLDGQEYSEITLSKHNEKIILLNPPEKPPVSFLVRWRNISGTPKVIGYSEKTVADLVGKKAKHEIIDTMMGKMILIAEYSDDNRIFSTDNPNYKGMSVDFIVDEATKFAKIKANSKDIVDVRLTHIRGEYTLTKFEKTV